MFSLLEPRSARNEAILLFLDNKGKQQVSMPLYGAKLDHSLPRQIFNLLVNPSLQVVTPPQSTSSETSSSSRSSSSRSSSHSSSRSPSISSVSSSSEISSISYMSSENETTPPSTPPRPNRLARTPPRVVRQRGGTPAQLAEIIEKVKQMMDPITRLSDSERSTLTPIYLNSLIDMEPFLAKKIIENWIDVAIKISCVQKTSSAHRFIEKLLELYDYRHSRYSKAYVCKDTPGSLETTRDSLINVNKYDWLYYAVKYNLLDIIMVLLHYGAVNTTYFYRNDRKIIVSNCLEAACEYIRDNPKQRNLEKLGLFVLLNKKNYRDPIMSNPIIWSNTSSYQKLDLKKLSDEEDYQPYNREPLICIMIKFKDTPLVVDCIAKLLNLNGLRFKCGQKVQFSDNNLCGTIIDPKNIQSGTKLHYSPNGWIKVKDSDLEEYYYNIGTGEVQPDNYCDTEMCEGDERRGCGLCSSDNTSIKWSQPTVEDDIEPEQHWENDDYKLLLQGRFQHHHSIIYYHVNKQFNKKKTLDFNLEYDVDDDDDQDQYLLNIPGLGRHYLVRCTGYNIPTIKQPHGFPTLRPDKKFIFNNKYFIVAENELKTNTKPCQTLKKKRSSSSSSSRSRSSSSRSTRSSSSRSTSSS